MFTSEVRVIKFLLLCEFLKEKAGVFFSKRIKFKILIINSISWHFCGTSTSKKCRQWLTTSQESRKFILQDLARSYHLLGLTKYTCMNRFLGSNQSLQTFCCVGVGQLVCVNLFKNLRHRKTIIKIYFLMQLLDFY